MGTNELRKYLLITLQDLRDEVITCLKARFWGLVNFWMAPNIRNLWETEEILINYANPFTMGIQNPKGSRF